MKDLSLRTRFYIIFCIAVGIALLALNAPRFRVGDIWFQLVLGGLASLSLILKVTGATNRSHYNISFVIYAFTLVMLDLPAAMFVILVSNLAEWAWRKYPWYIQCFNIASYLIAIQAAGLAISLINPNLTLFTLQATVAVLVSMAFFTLLNHITVGIVVWLARGENFSQSGILAIFPLLLDFSLMCLGAGTAFVWILNPTATVLTLVPLYLIYTTLKVPALERKSNMDAKTGLFNAEYFNTALEAELARAERFDRPLTVVMGDLDLLRNINNTYGHLAGDVVLKGIADIIKSLVREYDIVARFGGEEYAVLMPETMPEQAIARMEEIRHAIEQAVFVVETSVTPIQATMSFGIAGRTLGETHTGNALTHNADMALYHAKLTGRNRVVIYSEVGESPFVNRETSKSAGEPVPVPKNFSN